MGGGGSVCNPSPFSSAVKCKNFVLYVSSRGVVGGCVVIRWCSDRQWQILRLVLCEVAGLPAYKRMRKFFIC